MDNVPDDLALFEYDGIAFGRLCILDLVLATKVCNFGDVSAETRRIWLQFIETAVTAYAIVDKLCRQVQITALVHYDNYGIMLGARLAATKHGVPSYGLNHAAHNNIDTQRYAIVPEIMRRITFRMRDSWNRRWRELPLTEQPSQGMEVTTWFSGSAVKGRTCFRRRKLSTPSTPACSCTSTHTAS